MERKIIYGNLKEKPLKELLYDNKHFLMLTKDNINSCKYCEFRYACFDCRPDRLSDNIYEKPWYCTYNPEERYWMSEEGFLKKLIEDNKKV